MRLIRRAPREYGTNRKMLAKDAQGAMLALLANNKVIKTEVAGRLILN